jgi:hypothetical protein
VAFDSPITPWCHFQVNKPGWNLTPQYLQVAFDAPITLGWRLTPGLIFQTLAKVCKKVKSHDNSELLANLSKLAAFFFAMFWSAFKKPSCDFNFLHIFKILFLKLYE